MNRDASNSNKTCDKTVFLDLAADLCHKGTASRDSYSNTGISTQDRCTATVPRLEFEQAVRQHHADRHLRGFPCEGQFVAMLFCQLGQAHSLREICGGLAATEGKLKQLGLSAAPKRCTLSYANGQRPWQLFETVFPQRLGKCRGQLGLAAGGHKLRFKNRLLSLDTRVIDLGVSRFDWAQLQRTQGAIKLHLLLDQTGYLPSLAVVTTGKAHDLRVARRMQFANQARCWYSTVATSTTSGLSNSAGARCTL